MNIDDAIKFISEASKAELETMSLAIKKNAKKFPKEKKVKNYEPASESEIFRLECHRAAKKWLLEKYPLFVWGGLQNKGLNGLIDDIKSALTLQHGEPPGVERLMVSFVHFMCRLPPFYANKIDFNLYHVKFNAIVDEMRKANNGKLTTKGGGVAESAASINAQVIERLNARIRK